MLIILGNDIIVESIEEILGSIISLTLSELKCAIFDFLKDLPYPLAPLSLTTLACFTYSIWLRISLHSSFENKTC